MKRNAPFTESFTIQGYQDLLSIPPENKDLMDLLAQGRKHLGSLFGYDSYAEYTLDACCLAGNPQAVVTFLRDLNMALQPKVRLKPLNAFSKVPLTSIIFSVGELYDFINREVDRQSLFH